MEPAWDGVRDFEDRIFGTTRSDDPSRIPYRETMPVADSEDVSLRQHEEPIRPGVPRPAASELPHGGSEAAQARAIVEAASDGNLIALRFLTDPSCVPIVIPGEALIEAIYSTHTEAVQCLLDAGVDVKRPINGHSPLLIRFSGPQTGITPMYVACGMGSLAYVGMLRAVGAPVELLDIHEAVEHGCSTEFLRFVLTEIDQKLVDQENLTALLLLAIVKGKPELVQYLIEAGASAERQLLNAVACSALPSSVPIVQHVLNASGVDINRRSASGETALILAVHRRTADIVQLLLQQRGIDLNARGREDDRTAVMIAVEYGDADIVKLLLDAGCSTETFGAQPLLCTAVHNEKLSVIPVLLDAGADPTHCIECCVHASVSSHVRTMVRTVEPTLLPEYARIFASASLPAALEPVNVSVRLLLHRGDVNRCDARKLTPLAWACKQGNAPLVAALLSQGAGRPPSGPSAASDSNAGDNPVSGALADESSPLAIAVKQGRWDIVALLLRVSQLPA